MKLQSEDSRKTDEERERERERGASLTYSCKDHLPQWRVYIEEEAVLKIVARELAKVNFIKSMEEKNHHHIHMPLALIW